MNKLPKEQMLNSFFRPFADRGHWFDAECKKCIHCNAPTIDLYEDGHYGEIRPCICKAVGLLPTDEILTAAWKHCAERAAIENGFPRGFWPDVARVAVEMALQGTLEPKLDFRPTQCSRGGFEVPRTKDKKKLAESILTDIEGLF